MMLRSLANFGRRRFCTTSAPSAFHSRVSSTIEDLLNADWVDTDYRPIDIVVEKADNVIDEYRHTYTSETPHDEVFKDVERLYVTKEAASIVEAYGELAERTLRRHEGMLGFFGNNTNIPEGEANDAIGLLHDYIAFMNKVEDEAIRNKIETELGRKMVQIKMCLSVENFGLEIAPMAGDRILPTTPKPKDLPTEATPQKLSSDSKK